MRCDVENQRRILIQDAKVILESNTVWWQWNYRRPDNQPTPTNKELTDTQKLEESLTAMIRECTDTLTKWVSTVLAFALPTDSSDKLQMAVNKASEELLLCRLNILKSVDGHVYVGKEPKR